MTRAQAKRNQNSAKAVIKSSLKGEEGKDTGCPLKNNSEKKEPESGIRRTPANSAVTKLIDTRKFSSLTKLVRVIAWIWRAAMKWKMVLRKNLTLRKSKWEEFPSTEDVKSQVKHAVLIVGECKDAMRDLLLAT